MPGASEQSHCLALSHLRTLHQRSFLFLCGVRWPDRSRPCCGWLIFLMSSLELPLLAVRVGSDHKPKRLALSRLVLHQQYLVRFQNSIHKTTFLYKVLVSLTGFSRSMMSKPTVTFLPNNVFFDDDEKTAIERAAIKTFELMKLKN